MLLKAEGIDAHYGSAQVLHDVSVEARQGELVCIVGRNGAGKTTLLKTIAGFMHPSKGSVVFDGKSIGATKPEKVARLGIKYVWQDKRVFADLTVRENMELASYPLKADIDESLEKLFGRPADLVVPSAVRNPYFLRSIESTRTLLYAA